MSFTLKSPLVSIVTPSFNQAGFIEATIQSVLTQDYPHIEYIVVDGGSTDGTVELLRQYVDRLAYWTSEPDSGQTEAINKGFDRASGDIIRAAPVGSVALPQRGLQRSRAAGGDGDAHRVADQDGVGQGNSAIDCKPLGHMDPAAVAAAVASDGGVQ